MKEYQRVLKDIMHSGVDRGDRTGTGTRALFAQQMRFRLAEGFPAVTTKKLGFKAVKSELLWFISGSRDERELAKLNGTERTIWTDNAQADYWKPKAEFEGDLGRVYGVQWRNWQNGTNLKHTDTTHLIDIARFMADNPGSDYYKVHKQFAPALNNTDQLATVIEGIKKDPNGRRHIVTAWNPGELDQMALPPCHMIFQFFVAPGWTRYDDGTKYDEMPKARGRLSCHMNQRSCDMFLGVPFNIASYALLTHMVAQVCDLDVGELVITLGDAHVYSNHHDQVAEQLSRTPTALPTLWLNPDIKDIDDFTMDDIKLEDYVSQASIKAPMAV